MASASFYRTVAAGLDGLAAELEECAASGLAPAAENLTAALDGAATAPLQAEYQAAASGVRRGASALRAAADWARQEAGRIEAAEAAAAAASALADPPAEPLPLYF